jgi:hypothetical protein
MTRAPSRGGDHAMRNPSRLTTIAPLWILFNAMSDRITGMAWANWRWHADALACAPVL